ncbi:NADPH-dependent FMN reductase [Streptobacillus felis]|uniref:NADPH-dependent FMN reductase n=1 Tax=Streptobacillus felis TaxID=1384509 RepID=UPI000836C7AA|nr:NADPH-dependent FMN reductase [Streptobacillus felis]
MKKILLINGSIRKESFNQEILNYVSEKALEKGYTVDQVDYSEVPFFSQDIEFPTPNSVEKVRAKFENSDIVWIATPEYNGSVPGAFKNLLDWVSRPVVQGTFGAPEFVKGKTTVISGAAGRSQAALVLEELNGLLTRMGLNVLEERVGLALGEAFTTGKFILSDEQKEQINKVIEKL